MFKIKKVHPMFNSIVTTARRFVGEEAATTEGGLIIDTRKMDGAMNNFQQVIAVGNTVHELKEGDVVCINFSRYAVARHIPGKIEDNIETDNLAYGYQMPMIEIDGQKCLLLQTNDIEYYMEPGDYEVDGGGLFQ